ncbi:hypothetical protein Tco_0204065 [Tanacetum coccineum]
MSGTFCCCECSLCCVTIASSAKRLDTGGDLRGNIIDTRHLMQAVNKSQQPGASSSAEAYIDSRSQWVLCYLMMVPSQHSIDLAAIGVDLTHVQAAQPTNSVSLATASNKYENVEANIEEPPKELSIPPNERQITSMQNEDVQSKLPKTYAKGTI